MSAESAKSQLETKSRILEFLRKFGERSYGGEVKLSSAELGELREILSILTAFAGKDVPVVPPEAPATPFGGINSSRMASLEKLIAKAAACDLSVLIIGESGTGKELVAREIHRRSLRSAKPFFSENCAALTETLLESELFGHVRGSFTGAERDRKGILELADQGTLFLDELGDMSLAMQSKLLRVLQEGEVRSVGSRHTTRIDVRFISATNRDLHRLVEQGRFRLDLFYRINVITIALPALRDRREDIPPLIEHFIEGYMRKARCPRKHFDERALDLLCAYEWPGNIRELENTVQRCIVLSENIAMSTPDLPERIRRLEGLFDGSTRLRSPKTGEQILIERALTDSLGDKAKAARYIGWSRPKLYRKIREYGISLSYGQMESKAASATDSP
ncbi:MAG TPA: sigma-54 dependent transcriptional regulator [Candidatus Polarisedimenticolia bacterium]|jgi:transcriptional regulator with PAS, ATPase and Fis domain|nr:sigma-54 dependent transcriptional regulator [Candidatus Polarisedimenticolia bacterium]